MHECTDACHTANESVKETDLPVESYNECEISRSNESKYQCESDVCTSAAAFAASESDKELDLLDLQHSDMPTFESESAVNSSDTSKSVVCSLTDVHFHVEDSFACGEQLTTATTCEDRPAFNLGHSTADQQFAHDDWQQDPLSSTTFLSCTEEMSTKASRLALLASRVKALCKVMRPRCGPDENVVLALSLHSTQLTKEYQHRSLGHRRLCNVLIDGVRISSDKGNSTSTAKLSACSSAFKLLQRSYLHLEESSDNTVKLVGSEKLSVTESYNVVTKIDIPSSDYFLSTSELIGSSKQQTSGSRQNLPHLVARLKHLIDTVRTISHVLETTEFVKCRKVFSMASRVAGLSTNTHIIRGQLFGCSLFVDAVCVAYVEMTTKKTVKDSAFAAAVELFNKSYLHLVDSEHGLRLTGSDEQFGETASSTLPIQEDNSNDELDPSEVRSVAKQNLSTSVGQNDVSVAHCCAAVCEDCLLYTSPSPRDRQKSRMPSSA